jgi:hypothetical protein
MIYVAPISRPPVIQVISRAPIEDLWESLNFAASSSAPSAQATSADAGRKDKPVRTKLNIYPRKLHFGDVSVDRANEPGSVYVTNLSAVPVIVTSVAATPPFNVIANTCTTLAAQGGRCAVTVEFAPITPGKYKGTLQIIDGTAKNAQSVVVTGEAR